MYGGERSRCNSCHLHLNPMRDFIVLILMFLLSPFLPDSDDLSDFEE